MKLLLYFVYMYTTGTWLQTRFPCGIVAIGTVMGSHALDYFMRVSQLASR